MMKTRAPPAPHPTSIVIDVKAYTGTYTVAAKIITVSTGMGSKTTQVGGASAVFLARKLLGELVREGKA